MRVSWGCFSLCVKMSARRRCAFLCPAIDRALRARNNRRAQVFSGIITRSFMTNFNRKVEQASARVGQTVAETTGRLEQESAEFIKYLNDEVVPAVRQHSTKALRVASEKLTQLADYMEQQQRSARK